jgi:DNA-directed RNA polymerase subunit beta
MMHQFSEGVKNTFPVVTNANRTLTVTQVHAPDMPDPTDYNGQKQAIMSGGTWGVPVKATVAMHGADNKLLDKKVVRIGFLPTPTNRHTFVINGKEYQVNMQRRLRPAAYTKVNRLGEAVADFNLAKGRNFALTLDPEANQFNIKFGNTRVPLNPVLKHVLGADSLGLGKAFDTPFSEKDEHAALSTMHSMIQPNKPVPTALPELRTNIREYFHNVQMDPGVNRLTLGLEADKITAPVLQAAAKQVLAVHRKEKDPTGKDQLAFTEIHGVEDFVRERLEKNRFNLAYKLRPRVDKAEALGDVGLHRYVQPFIDQFFTQSAQSNHVMQINPLEMKENAFKLSSLGEGAIGDTHAIGSEVRAVHPSSMGFIDPVRTPDNASAGVDVRLALSATKQGKQLMTRVLNARTGKPEFKTPVELFDSVVAHDTEPTEHGLVRAVHQGMVIDAKPQHVQYRIPTGSQFTVSTTMVPFIQSTHAHRAAMGAKMLGQAVSLVDREPPIVDTPFARNALEDFVVRSPAAGTVHKIDPGVIHLKTAQGQVVKVNYPHEFPLNGGSFLHGDLQVKPGDKVTPGQLLAGNNFTTGAAAALGKNLTVAFMPYKGLNHEDAIVVTRQGADKLVSQHLHTEEALIDERSVFDLAKFKAHFPTEFENKHFAKVDEHGVVKVGQVLTNGDPIMLGLRKRLVTPEELILGRANKGFRQPYANKAVVWDRPYEGKVMAVEKTPEGIKVAISAKATVQVGDKLSGRHGNKGVISAIIPDHEAPRTADGQIPDVILNSAGLTSRMNNGQIFETIAAKSLQKLGIKQQVFPHFQTGNVWEKVNELARKAGTDGTEELFDPTTKRSLGRTLMGPMYMLKLFKQAETGFSARSGGEYDIDLRPAKGGEEGAKSIGTLDLYSLLAQGSRALLQDVQHKSEANPEVLQAMWQGKPLPPAKPTFAFKKFEGMLQGMGLNLKKEGNSIALLPMTNKDVLTMSSGAVTQPLTVHDKPDPTTGLPYRPEEGGLFDTRSTGGLVGNRWSHINLTEPIVNPLFANATRTLLGLTKQSYADTLYNHGAEHIKEQLSKIDVKTKIKQLSSEVNSTNSVSKKDAIYKQLKFLKALDQADLKPQDAYILNHVPVIPPAMRPIYPDSETGRLVVSDANHLYKSLMLVNDQLTEHKKIGDPTTIRDLRKGLHEAFEKVQGLDPVVENMRGERPAQGFLKVIAGSGQAKDGYFQSKLLSRRQDITGRGVIVPDPSLGIDEVGIPHDMAMKIYRNHAIGDLVQGGMPLPVAARHFEDKTPTASQAVLNVMAKTPLVLSRAPSLHKFNLVGLKPRIVDGKSLHMNTLVLKGLNADFDGDQMGVNIPVTPEGVKDVYKMLPSNNLFNPLNHAPMHVPSQETVLGLWKATAPQGSSPVARFRTKEEAIAAYREGRIRINDPISIE